MVLVDPISTVLLYPKTSIRRLIKVASVYHLESLGEVKALMLSNHQTSHRSTLLVSVNGKEALSVSTTHHRHHNNL